MNVRNWVKFGAISLAILVQVGINGSLIERVSAIRDGDKRERQHIQNLIERNAKSTVTITRRIGLDGGASDNGTIMGSGVVYSRDALIITSCHIVRGMDVVHVITNDGRVLTGRPLAFDEVSDVALVQVEPEGLMPADFGSSLALKPGAQVYAMGTPLSPVLRNSVSTGIVSSNDRTGYGDYRLIQSDFASSPGFSGGPLIDTSGYIVGLVSFKSTEPGCEGLSFSLRIEDVLEVTRQLVAFGRVKSAFTGIELSEIMLQRNDIGQPEGLLVSGVIPGSPAELAGVKPNDLILSLQGKTIRNRYDYLDIVRDYEKGIPLRVEVNRDGRIIELALNPIVV